MLKLQPVEIVWKSYGALESVELLPNLIASVWHVLSAASV
jgi:hypothetical protein